DPDRDPRHDPFHRDDLPGRSLVDPRRPLRRRGARGGERLGPVPRHHLSVDEAFRQHRHGAEYHLRLQLLPDHLGNDAGRAGELARYHGDLSLQARLPLGQAGPGGGCVDRNVRHPAGRHHRLCAPRHARRGPSMTKKLRRSILAWLLLSPLVVVILFPYAVMLITALKPATEVLQPHWWPSRLRFANFVEMWGKTNFGPALLNSLYIAAFATVATILVSIPAAYALS